MIELPVPSRAIAEADAHAAYQAAIAELPDAQRAAIVTFVEKVLDDSDERHETLRTLQARHDNPVAVEAFVGEFESHDLGDVVVIDIRSAGRRTAAQFDAVLAQAMERKPRGIILDLRRNHGGDARTARDIASHFVPSGSALARFVPQVDGVQPFDLVTQTAPSALAVPLVIAVDRWTASTSELLAGALQVIGRATIVGPEPSFGKPVASSIVDGEPMALGHFEMPDGSSFVGVGLRPDTVTADPVGTALEVIRAS